MGLVHSASQSSIVPGWLPPESKLPSNQAIDRAFDARGADWRGLDLGATDLTEARLCRVDLRGTNLSECTLDGADLRLARYDGMTIWPDNYEYRDSGAVGPKAKLSGHFLNSADLSGMDLSGSLLMGAYLSGADLSGACLRGVRLAGADLRHAVLRGALCEGVRFSGCQLDYADFRWASLTDADLSAAESIRGSDFTSSSGLDSIRETLIGRPFQELDCWNPLTRHTTRDSLMT
ncbi:pentapeptide repeat-containing protein [Synechococcus sp. RedBA-s]|nr:pentapeptide repeat-containing protein [Synechococcus sp. RedBA-s]